MEQIQREHKISRFTLVTEALPPSFARKFSSEILDRRLQLGWMSFVMAHEGFDKPLFEHMKEAGCYYLVVGLESLSDGALDNVSKYAGREENVRFISEALEAEISIHINLIPNLPGTTYKDALEAYPHYLSWKKQGATFSVFPFEATASSKIGQNPEAFGLERELGPTPVAGQASFSENHVEVTDPAMSATEQSAVLDLYRVL